MFGRVHRHVLASAAAAVLGAVPLGVGGAVVAYHVQTAGEHLGPLDEMVAAFSAVLAGVALGLFGCWLFVWQLLRVQGCRHPFRIAAKASALLLFLLTVTLGFLVGAGEFLTDVIVPVPGWVPVVCLLVLDAAVAGALAAASTVHPQHAPPTTGRSTPHTWDRRVVHEGRTGVTGRHRAGTHA